MIKNAPASRITAAAVVVCIAFVAGAGACRSDGRTLRGYQGVVEYDERDLAFEVSGRLAAVEVEPGDRVRADTVIARLDDSLAESTLLARQAEAEAARDQLRLLRAGARAEDVRALRARVAAARASETLLEKNARRMRELEASGAVTAAALDESEAELERARAERQALEENLQALSRGARWQEVEGARHRLEAAQAAVVLERERLSRHVLRAGADGQVLQRHLESSEMAPAGVPVVTIADVEHPFADVFVPQAEIAGVRLGLPVTARTDGLAEPVSGVVELIARRTEFTPRFLFSEDERSNLVLRVRVRLSDPESRLHAGVPIFVELGAGPSRAPREDARP